MKKLLIAMAFGTLEELLQARKVPVEYQAALAKLFVTIQRKQASDDKFAKAIEQEQVPWGQKQ